MAMDFFFFFFSDMKDGETIYVQSEPAVKGVVEGGFGCLMVFEEQMMSPRPTHQLPFILVDGLGPCLPLVPPNF